MVVMDSRKRRDGAAIEELGWYNPIDIDHSFDLKGNRILHWLKEGAQTTEAAHKLLRRSGIAHKWHLMKQGLDNSEIEIEMKKWELNRVEVLKNRSEKLDKRNKEKEIVSESIEEKITDNSGKKSHIVNESQETLKNELIEREQLEDNTEEE